jgi:hypothetical protein
MVERTEKISLTLCTRRTELLFGCELSLQHLVPRVEGVCSKPAAGQCSYYEPNSSKEHC